jgi:hypothetical protein
MYMVGITTYDEYLTIQVIANATQIGVQLALHRRVYQRLSVLGAENDVQIVFYERLSHAIGFVRVTCC